MENYPWTITNRMPRNLPQLYGSLKGKSYIHEVKNADQYSSSQYEAIARSLDEFCQRITAEQHLHVY